MKLKILNTLILFQLFFPGALLAIEPAPDITDREVIEKLTKLEAGQQALKSEMQAGQQSLKSEMQAGQQALKSEMQAGQQSLNQRISDLRSEMKTGRDAMNKRLSDLRSEMKTGRDAMNKRLDDLSQRISSLTYVMVTMFGSLVALIAVLVGLMLWDRRTTVKPVVEKVERLEQDVSENFDLSDEFRLKVNRLIKALRELAATDERLASVLRSCSLL